VVNFGGNINVIDIVIVVTVDPFFLLLMRVGVKVMLLLGVVELVVIAIEKVCLE